MSTSTRRSCANRSSPTGKMELEVVRDGSRFTVDNGDMAAEMTLLLSKNVVDPELRACVMPVFTTTSKNDEF